MEVTGGLLGLTHTRVQQRHKTGCHSPQSIANAQRLDSSFESVCVWGRGLGFRVKGIIFFFFKEEEVANHKGSNNGHFFVVNSQYTANLLELETKEPRPV